jgi:hypothetical protein
VSHELFKYIEYISQQLYLLPTPKALKGANFAPIKRGEFSNEVLLMNIILIVLMARLN